MIAIHLLTGSRLISGSRDHTLQVTNIETESRVATIQEDHTEYEIHASVAANENGNIVVSACGSKVKIYNFEVFRSFKDAFFLFDNIMESLFIAQSSKNNLW